MPNNTSPSVAIVGGGLAGLAAAAALGARGLPVELFEARRALGGRAGSFRDPGTGDHVDHCQHVGMGCCTNWLDFCNSLGLEKLLRRDRVLHFFGPNGKRYDLRAAPLLPAPLHLMPALARFGYLSWSERISIARAVLRLAREPAEDRPDMPTIGRWLASQGQSARALEQFWGVVLVSALGELLDRASLSAAQKVFIDGFLGHRSAYEVYVPQAPLAELYAQAAEKLQGQGVKLHLQTPVKQLVGTAQRLTGVQLASGETRSFDYLVLAVPWQRVRSLLPESVVSGWTELAGVERYASSPIMGVHVWFERPFMSLPHAVLVGRTAQWVFYHGPRRVRQQETLHYYQIVLSAVEAHKEVTRELLTDELLRDIEEVFPAAKVAGPKYSRVVVENEAVFSVRPGLDQLRPEQRTRVSNLFLAGDWTRTGWPATMESAVRSGRLAAEGILAAQGEAADLLTPDLPRSWLARLLVGRKRS